MKKNRPLCAASSAGRSKRLLSGSHAAPVRHPKPPRRSPTTTSNSTSRGIMLPIVGSWLTLSRRRVELSSAARSHSPTAAPLTQQPMTASYGARIAPSNRQPNTDHSASGPSFLLGCQISHGEVSYEETAVSCGADGVRDTVCPEPVRWNLDGQAGYSHPARKARPLHPEQQHVRVPDLRSEILHQGRWNRPESYRSSLLRHGRGESCKRKF